MAKWSDDKLGAALSDTPSPEDVVRAALESAERDVQEWADCECAPSLDLIRNGIRAIANDRAAVDQIIEQAKGRG